MSTVSRTEHRQLPYGVRLEWGLHGVQVLAAECAAVVVVDVMSFCTAVDVALGRGASVLPQRWATSTGLPLDHIAAGEPEVLAAAAREASVAGAVAAGPRGGSRPSLRPSSLLALQAGTRLALPSPNGATLCAAAVQAAAAAEAAGRPGAVLFAGCLRNASAVARAARAIGGPVGLVPAGERWPDGTLRVAVEDAIGAGAIAAALPRVELSPEAQAAVDQFTAARERGLGAVLAALSSGEELVADGYRADVTLAAAHDVSTVVPRLQDGLLSAWAPPGAATAGPPRDGGWTDRDPGVPHR